MICGGSQLGSRNLSVTEAHHCEIEAQPQPRTAAVNSKSAAGSLEPVAPPCIADMNSEPVAPPHTAVVNSETVTIDPPGRALPHPSFTLRTSTPFPL
ncbi:hypothetical protein TIFTF001_018680 [Ficus carica]|uniref:Uncharacterized protein n=1 Tax=Ficus carica TaxID=3494 RepID=A0AA88D864_FICCA|nr:hypothetical protein TIFTF001_018680 [Ficus carica]